MGRGILLNLAEKCLYFVGAGDSLSVAVIIQIEYFFFVSLKSGEADGAFRSYNNNFAFFFEFFKPFKAAVIFSCPSD